MPPKFLLFFLFLVSKAWNLIFHYGGLISTRHLRTFGCKHRIIEKCIIRKHIIEKFLADAVFRSQYQNIVGASSIKFSKPYFLKYGRIFDTKISPT